MYSDEEILSFMDLLDLDEEVIDLKAQNLMKKNTFTTRHLNNFIHLLRYKQLINIRENSECDNELEFNFIGKLITNIDVDNTDTICKIITTVLSLNLSTIIFKSEHLIQQIFAELYLPLHTNLISSDVELEKLETTLRLLKICGSILDAVEKSNYKLSLPFLTTPLEHIVCSNDEKLLIYFLTKTVPQLFTNVDGYNILDRIWDLLKGLQYEKAMVALKVLCCLSNYYLPVADIGKTIESHIITENQFFDFILMGLSSEDAFARKQSIYLAKRAIDYIMKNNKSVSISSKSNFVWDDNNKIDLKKMWDNFFILIDSLEEKQSNIVLPSIKLFDLTKNIGHCWLNCAFNIGLKHDNTQVRFQCLQHHLQYGIQTISEAKVILETINDIVLFDNEYKMLMDTFGNVIEDEETLMRILKAVPLVKWSPVPLYHVTKAMTNFNGTLSQGDQITLIDVINDLPKILCNNIIIRKCIQINISHIIGNCCKDLNWRNYMLIYSHLQIDNVTYSDNSKLYENPLVNFFKNDLLIPQEDIADFLNVTTHSYANIEFALLYFEDREGTDFIHFIDETMEKITDISKRQYADMTEYLKDIISMAHLYNKSIRKNGGIYDMINANAIQNIKTLLQYILNVLVSDKIMDIEKIKLLFEDLDQIITETKDLQEKEHLLKIYKATILYLKDNYAVMDKKVLSIFMLCNSMKSPIMFENYRHELLDVKTLVEIILNVKFVGNYNKENNGRLRNAFYEKSCEIVNILLNTDNLQSSIIDFIEVLIENGGYGCLKWILRIMNKIISPMLRNKDIKFDIVQFLNRMWTEMDEIKSNNQYPVCMREFVTLITQDVLLENSIYNNIILSYCSKMIDNADVKNLPLYLLVNRLNKVEISKYNYMVYVLSEILLNPVVPKKDHRIVENVLHEILEQPLYGIEKNTIFFNSNIQLLVVCTLSKISEPKVLDTITCFIMNKIEELFKNKQRYHNNSHLQRALQACVQNLLFIMLKSRRVNFQSTAMWSMQMLGRIPHQPFEKMCLEWYISLYMYLKKIIINQEIVNQLKANNISLSSQFVILYWVVAHKLKAGTCLSQEFEFLFEYLLSHVMGPVFSVRLQAQYFSSILYEANEFSNNKFDSSKYAYTIAVINSTLQEIAKVGDKSFKKLKNDYFLSNFDIIKDLIPCGIYWVFPQLADALGNDIIENEFLINIIGEIEDGLNLYENDEFNSEWNEQRRKTSDVLKIKANNKIINKKVGDLEETVTIQKKYVPWKNMSDINVYDNEMKTNKTELIVVASLIDKLPNLGGMARTSEVFGVQTYVVDSVRHLLDKQFQGLSVSAERWVTVEEVRPGQPLKDYLMMKKAEGYSVVAAEQTSTSNKLQTFKFPKKTILLLGNEKEGVPCDLLPLMDHCVEIPQQGVIRSLNVHVTAAIFIWEYARQNIL